MHNKISLKALLLLMTFSAVIAALYRTSSQNAVTAGLLMLIQLVITTLGLYAIMFLIAYPLGRLNKYFTNQADQGASPFATDRLPKQILPPTNNSHE